MKKETKKTYSSSRPVTALCAFIAGIVMLASFNASALGQLMVSPTRIVFEANERSKQISLINNGSETGRFKISFVRRNMSDDGRIQEVANDEPGLYADEMVKFSPRLVTLAPGESQTVRLMLRKKSGMVDGEYRSHLLFQSLPDPEASDVSNLASDESAVLSVKLIPVVGITIPVIVRQGKLSAEVSLSDFEIQQANTVRANAVLSLKINRQGNQSAYGDFRVSFTPRGGKPVVVGQVNGVAVYTSTESRRLEIPLQIPSAFKLSNGELDILYLQPGKDEKTGLIAQARLSVP